MTTGTVQAIEATLKALNQISSNESSTGVLIEAGILPPLDKDLFSVGYSRLPTRLKELSARILSNLVASGTDLEAVPVGDSDQTLLSEDVVHNLLHLISNTGPAIERKLLQVLVGLTSSPTTVSYIVSGIKSSGATISLVQFIEAARKDICAAALKLLHNISPHMSIDLAETLGGSSGHLGTVLDVVSDNNGITEEAIKFSTAPPIFDTLIQNQTEIIQKRAVWAVERFLRVDNVAKEVSGNQNVASALVEVYRNSNYRTRQIAERALKHIERLTNFS